MKITKRSRAYGKLLFFREWLKAMRRSVEQKELEEYERQQQILLIKEQTAEIHRKRCLKRRAFKGIKKHTM